MEQMLSSGDGLFLLDDTFTEYASIIGSHGWTTSNVWAEQIVSTSGKIKNLRVRLNDSPGAGTSYDFTLMVNGAPSALTLTISDAETSGADITHEVDVVAGDDISLRCDPTGTPTPRYAYWTSMFEGATAKESLILRGKYYSKHDGIIYASISGGRDGNTVAENDSRQVCPTSGKIKNLYVKLSADPGTAPDAYRFTLRVNGVSSALTCTITADDTTGNDTEHEVTVSAEDVLTLMIEPLNTPEEFGPITYHGMTFVADIDGESIILGGTEDDLHDTNTEYTMLPANKRQDWRTTENSQATLGQLCTLKKLYVLLSAAPGDGNSYDFTVRVAGGDGNLTVHIHDTDTTGNDLVNTDVIANDDLLALKCVPTGTPNVVDAYWGLVSAERPYILENKSANMGSKMVAAGLI